MYVFRGTEEDAKRLFYQNIEHSKNSPLGCVLVNSKKQVICKKRAQSRFMVWHGKREIDTMLVFIALLFVVAFSGLPFYTLPLPFVWYIWKVMHYDA